MRKSILKPFVYAAVLLIVIGVSSCKKNDDATPTPAAGFSWTLSGTTYTADNDTAFVSGPFLINAAKDEATLNQKFFEIDLTAFAVGAYTLTSSGSNQLNYVTTSGVQTSQSGTLNITANTGSLLTGNFTTVLGGGLTMTGNFTNMPIRP